MMKKRRVNHQAYHSYHGIRGIPFVSPYAPVSLGEGIYMDSGCPGHVVLGPPEDSENKEKMGKR